MAVNFCQNCGIKFSESGVNKCHACGEDLTPKEKIVEKVKEIKGKGNTGVMIMVALVVGVLGFLIGSLVSPQIGKMAGTVSFQEADEAYNQCIANCEQISSALEMYSLNNGANYPKTIQTLVPDYLEALPRCPGSRSADVYTSSYEVSKDLKRYTFCCKGHYHKDAGIPPNYPLAHTTGIDRVPPENQ